MPFYLQPNVFSLLRLSQQKLSHILKEDFIFKITVLELLKGKRTTWLMLCSLILFHFLNFTLQLKIK